MRKRLILLLTILITFMGSSAQQTTSTQRLKFMGKSMDCSVSEMATHLRTKGCKIKDKKEGFIFMRGTFQGYRDCIFALREDYKILGICSVVIPRDNLNKLCSVYNDIVYQFRQKYGVPQTSKSGFKENPYLNYERLNLVNGKCLDYNIFFIEEGAISVRYISNGLNGSVLIIYEDNIAKDKIEKIQQDEL